MKKQLLLLCLFSCQTPNHVAPTPASQTSASQSRPLSLPTLFPSPQGLNQRMSLPYDCSLLSKTPEPQRCDKAKDGLSALWETAQNLPDYATPFDGESIATDWKSVSKALQGAKEIDLKSMSLDEKIFAQNAALRIFAVAQKEKQAETSKESAALIKKLALSSKELLALGEEPHPDLSTLLGPKESWQPMKLQENTKHVRHYLGAIFFRAYTLPNHTQALIGQLIAIDTAGEPHITPIVYDAKFRFHTNEKSKRSVCVAELDLSQWRCATDFRMKAPDSVKELHTSTFVTPVGEDRLACNFCHGGRTEMTAIMPPEERAAGEQQNREISFRQITTLLATPLKEFW
jgi:hypothetical protein